eukprot:316358-Chlamydomonas_euryale.AAC.2
MGRQNHPGVEPRRPRGEKSKHACRRTTLAARAAPLACKLFLCHPASRTHAEACTQRLPRNSAGCNGVTHVHSLLPWLPGLPCGSAAAVFNPGRVVPDNGIMSSCTGASRSKHGCRLCGFAGKPERPRPQASAPHVDAARLQGM